MIYILRPYLMNCGIRNLFHKNWQQKGLYRKELICEVCEQSLLKCKSRVADQQVQHHLGRKISSYLHKPCLKSLCKHICKTYAVRTENLGLYFCTTPSLLHYRVKSTAKTGEKSIKLFLNNKVTNTVPLLCEHCMGCYTTNFNLNIYIGLKYSQR